MRICIVNSYYPPWIGGAETYVSNLAKQLVARGHAVTVCCAERPLSHGTTNDGGVMVRRMRSPATFYGTPIVISPAALMRVDCDLFHSNFPGPYLSALSASISRLRRLPAVLTLHTD